MCKKIFMVRRGVFKEIGCLFLEENKKGTEPLSAVD
jgi:hypothetical protein